MDPLSITTGVITILQATTTVIAVCYDFRAALKNDSWSLTAIINELKSLRTILEDLEELVQDVGKANDLAKKRIFELLSDPDAGPLSSCQQELYALDKTIRASSYTATNGSKKKAILQALHWQLKDKEAKDCLIRIQRCKSTLSLALGADTALVKSCSRPCHFSSNDTDEEKRTSAGRPRYYGCLTSYDREHGL
ncbi:hypothetical protein N0V83_010352 [Neocucurbitaria cava]|uniref:Azaphilone pigments biosynthesis cluster protein L N-terminal domain-containing protein n=1 Tax=Neocucurbitaria cava TaxID=798079 RepID=A0A9W8Y0H8_9PLEO|nr:hypothetical protein N0V83_010352 [Neocucurbitaria cava]